MRRDGLAASLLLVALLLPGCATPGALAGAELARPRLGDVAEYAVSGHLLEFSRWANGVPLPGAAPRLTLALEPVAGTALDGNQARHPVFRVVETLDGSPHRDLLVSPELASIVQGYAPLSGRDAVVAFDERGYPWAWGASLWHGVELERGAARSFSLPANGGQPGPLDMRAVVREKERVGERDAWRVDLERPDGARWSIWLAPDVPYPVRVAATLGRGEWAPFVRLDDQGPTALAFRADLASFTRGTTPLPPRDPGRTWAEAPLQAAFSEWDREMPPDGDGAYAPFLLADAVAWAKSFDPGFRNWLAANAGAILYRATYLAKPGPVPASATSVWLVQYVSKSDAYYEFQVERTASDATAGVAGVTQVTLSRPARAPEGAHGWFDPATLPDRLLTVDSAVTTVRDLFAPLGVEIFVRSFVDPPGYAYYVDGGFEEKLGRYTVIVNAQTGFVQAAVGPREPLLRDA